jgi:hypothetical protein
MVFDLALIVAASFHKKKLPILGVFFYEKYSKKQEYGLLKTKAVLLLRIILGYIFE